MGRSEHRTKLFDLPVDVCDTLDAHLTRVKPAIENGGSRLFVSFINPASFHMAKQDPDYLRCMHAMDVVLPDGIGVVWALRMLNKVKAARISFDASSLFHPVFSCLNAVEGRVFVMGSRLGVAEQAATRMLAAYPRLTVVGVLDGYQSDSTYVAEVERTRPDLVLCGMGAPHQERVLAALKASGYRGVAYTCGGFLDQYNEKESYYPQWIDKWELRWLYRLCREPRRLARRYLGHYQTFVGLVLISAVGMGPTGRGPRRLRFRRSDFGEGRTR